VQTRELEREYRAVVEEILDLRGADDRVREFLRAITEAGALADTCAYAPDITFAQRVELLEKLDIVERLNLALELQRERLAELQVRRRIREDVEEGAQKQQREWFLRQQMNSIRKELGEDEGSVVDEYRTKIEEAGMPEDVRTQAERELRRLETMGDASGEASMIRTYLDWLIAVPWSQRSDETLDPQGAREVLDADHAGLEDVKDRIVEYLAVRKLREDRGIPNDKRSGAILTLIGPPGTGKTSIGESVARALNREFVRMSLGGVRDEEPGHPPRRGGQGRRRLARRSVRGAARGARPGAEPLVPRPLPRCRARPLRGLLHRDRERRRHDPRTVARPDGGHPLRRLHG
jgi:ATP-dependent Lon protease